MNRSISPLTLVAILLIGGGMLAWKFGGSDDLQGCSGDPSQCAPVVTAAAQHAQPPPLSAESFCLDVGYLCAQLDQRQEIQLRRWAPIEGPIVVHVPLADGLSSGDARALQQAAAQGVRAWNGQPFPILVDLRGDRSPHFTVRWSNSLSGSQLGVTRTRWMPSTGLEVEFVELGTRNLRTGRGTAEPRQIRLTAAHEMGHALGLDHSDSPRDIMYPTNTATSMSAQDYRSIEVLYATPDGTIIRR